jgi:ElaA protein
MLEIEVKTYEELTNEELYNLLQLRSQVFVVEQQCPYLDIDGKDINAVHILCKKNTKIVAYTRIFKPDVYFKNASISRVVVNVKYRNKEYGYQIIKAAITSINNLFNTSVIELSAQAYLKQFYINLGFNTLGNEYLEDNIPHIMMIKN